MQVLVDADASTITIAEGAESRTIDLYSTEAFGILSKMWLRTGWALKYPYGFSWMGRPVIQLPEDMLVIQEVLYRVRPDVLIETGVAHGGSLIFYASLFRAMGHGRVVGVDIEIRPHNRAAIEAHEMSPLITLIEGSSTDESVVSKVRDLVGTDERAMVVLDSNHARAHVLKELEAYAPLVAPGSYIVATDGIMADLYDVPRGHAVWRDDNPTSAGQDFLATHPEFELEDPPPFTFSETPIDQRVTHWPGAYLRRAR